MHRANHIILFSILISFLSLSLLLIPGCSASSKAAIQYTNHLNHVLELIRKHKHNTDVAGTAILGYTQENQAEITEMLQQLAAYDPDAIAAQYKRVMKPILQMKELLATDPVLYTDAINANILDILKENQQLVDQKAGEIREQNYYFLKKLFADFAATMEIIKTITADTPLKALNLKNNPEFVEAARIMKFYNLL